MNKDSTVFSIIIIVLFIMVSIIYFKPIPENYIPWAIVGLTFLLAIIMYALRGGAIPSILITKYLPLPLALISPPSASLERLFEERILPAVEAVVELSEAEVPEKAYKVIKHVREFFRKELAEANLGDTNAIRRKLSSIRLYENINDEDERKNFQYSLATLIHWITRYRNIAMHSKEPDPIDAWFALRTALIYIRNKYPLREATLKTKCPKCNTVNTLKLSQNETRWLQEKRIKCTKCGNNYKIKLTPTIIAEHYQIHEHL